MPSGTGAPGELRPSTSPLDSHSSDVTPHELAHDGLRESAFFVAVGPAPEPGSSDGVTEVTASAGAGEPTEALYLLERDSLAWGRQEFHWGRTFWFELELGPA